MAAIFAALSAALLFVRGVIVGAAKLVDRLLGFAGDVERDVLADLTTGSLTLLVLTPLEFVFVSRRTDGRVPATDAGRVRPLRPELEGVRVIAGIVLWRKLEGGGVLSFKARSAALLFVLGATVGAFVLATEMVSLRL